MRNNKIENPLVDQLDRKARRPLITGLVLVALVVSGATAAVLSGKSPEKKQQPEQTPKLKVCTPEQQRRIQELIKKSQIATGDEVKVVLSQLDKTLGQELDCGWEPVKKARKQLSSRLQP